MTAPQKSSGRADAERKPRDGPSAVQRAERHIWRRMASGFMVLVPLLVTIMVLRFIVHATDGLVRPFVAGTALGFLDVPGVGLATTLVLLYILGSVVSWEIGRRAIDWQDAILTRVPIVKSIYGVARQATDAFSAPMDQRFSRVVFIEWPRAGFVSLGLVTGRVRSPKDPNEVLVAVYIPTVPNPTSGNLSFVPEKDVIETTISVESAMKIVFSGGIVLPAAEPGSRGSDVPRA